MANPLQFYRDRLTDAQRRRLEVLIAVTALCTTTNTGFSQRQAAQWIATGRWETT